MNILRNHNDAPSSLQGLVILAEPGPLSSHF